MDARVRRHHLTGGPLTNRGGLLTSRLIDLAKHLRDARKHGEELVLSSEEAAFYDALAENGSAREVMKNDTLRLMARELTEMVKKMPRLDWTQRESVRADLRPCRWRDAVAVAAGRVVDGVFTVSVEELPTLRRSRHDQPHVQDRRDCRLLAERN